MLEGKYQIIQPLAEGGMGVVYKAEHVLMKKIVAIKRLHKNLMNLEQVVQRFEREAQAAAKIDHPNVCAVTDCGRDELGAFFIVMELLEGESLQDIMDKQGRLPLGRIFKIAIQICDGLEKAHSMGVVHRDLKPENIMLVRRDEKEDVVKIMDFGIAKMVADDSPTTSLTQAGMIFGTPHFLSPEQAAGDTIDHRSDLYSLGVIMFNMATGKYVFDDSTVGALLRKHISATPPLLAEAAPDRVFPDGLQPVLSRLLAKNPEDRYATAGQLRDHLIVIYEATRAVQQSILDEESSVQVDIVDDESSISRPIDLPLPPQEPTGSSRPLEQIQVQLTPAPDSVYEHPSMPPPAGAESRFGRRWREDAGFRALILILSIITASALLVTILFFTKIFGKTSEEYEEASPDQIQAALEQKRALFNEIPEITNALSLAVDKKDQESLDALLPLEDDPRFKDNPHYYYHLANALIRTGKVGDGVDAVEACLALEPDYAYDPMTLEVLVAGLRSEATRKKAAALLIDNVTVTMKDTLDKLAREDKDDTVRRTALSALNRKGLLERLEPWRRDAIDLANPDASCPFKKEAFSRIENVDEKGLVPTLELLLGGKRCAGQKCTLCLGEGLVKKYEALTERQGSDDEP
jgi:serine/threonine-protein kinase